MPAHTIIDAFRGEHYFLSNYFPAPVPFRGIVFPTSEHAFAAAKTTDIAAVQAIASALTPGDAKAIGRRVALIPHWDALRYATMHDILLAKFTHNPELRDKLLATRGALLVEGNTWHDQTWGSCSCPQHANVPGDNALGVLLMMLRLRLDVERGGR